MNFRGLLEAIRAETEDSEVAARIDRYIASGLDCGTGHLLDAYVVHQEANIPGSGGRLVMLDQSILMLGDSL